MGYLSFGCIVISMKNTTTKKQPDVPDDTLISPAKAAELCGMTREAINTLLRNGRFRTVEADGRSMVYLREIEVYADEER